MFQENFIWAPLIGFIETIGNSITFDYLTIGVAVLLLLVFVVTIIKTKNSYELRLLKTLIRLNKYFAKNPYVNEENLVKFNDLMKSVPKNLRTCWQEYVLNRDKLPSEYMNVVACVDQPIKTSSYASATNICGHFVMILSALSLLLGFSRIYVSDNSGLSEILLFCTVVPVLTMVVGYLFVSYLRARRTAITSNLYINFHEFERNMNKACSTMPEYIDYEILFTKREIKESIPVLQDYLEKRKLQEKKAQEEAEFNAIKYEDFDFSALGVDNSLLLERAMKESERYMRIKNALQEKINTQLVVMENYQKNFDEVTKNFERKAQASRETLAQLNDQISKTTSSIDLNYLKKSQSDAQKELQQLEKDYELSSTKFQKQQDEIQNEINILKQEIEKRKRATEEAMSSECKSYAGKVHDKIKESVVEQSKPILEEIEKKKTELEMQVADLNNTYEINNEKVEQQEKEIQELKSDYSQKVAELAAVQNLKDYFASAEFVQKLNLNNSGSTNSEDVEVENLRNSNAQLSAQVESLNAEISNLLAENKKLKEENNKKVNANNVQKDVNELLEIQKSIEEENEKLKKEQEKLQNTIDKTISEIEKPKKSVKKSNPGVLKENENVFNPVKTRKMDKINKMKKSLNQMIENADNIETKRKSKKKNEE